jgi:hypothetical protein
VPLLRRVWEYGTVKPVRVLDVIVTASYAVVTCSSTEPEEHEAFVLLQNLAVPRPEIGDTGCIEFKRGGPMGGYWDYQQQRIHVCK